MSFCFCFAMLFTILLNASAELHSAMADIYRLVETENDRMFPIHEYIARQERRLQRIQRLLKTYKQDMEEVLENSSRNGLNQLNTFATMSKLFSPWNSIQKMVMHDESKEFLSEVKDLRDQAKISFPDSDDVDGIAKALFRIQDTYNISTKDMADGKILDLTPMGALTSFNVQVQTHQTSSDCGFLSSSYIFPGASYTCDECYELGRYAYTQNDWYHMLSWMQEALERWQEGDKITKSKTLSYLSMALYEQDNHARALQAAKEARDLDPSDEDIEDNYHWYAENIDDEELEFIPPLKNPRPEATEAEYLRDEYEQGCRGEFDNQTLNNSKLLCELKTNHPFLLLAPIKVEVMHTQPRIVLFRDVVSDEEIELLKNISKPMMGNYGIGGHYVPHRDHIALSQPMSGGGTVFPLLKVLVPAVKNGAAFWHNVKHSGDTDPSTVHAGCPVAGGTKWVANKWIHERGQEFKRPCSLHLEDYE